MFLFPYMAEVALTKFNIDYIYFQENKIILPFLVKPLEKLLTLIGLNVYSQGLVIYYENMVTSSTSSVWIATSCSGYYSVILFMAAYLSYMRLNYPKINLLFNFFIQWPDSFLRI